MDEGGKDHSECEIVWEGEPPSAEWIAMARDSIRRELADLSAPGDLGFHVIFLGPDFDGPTATLWGEKGDEDRFHGEWSETTEWVPLSEAALP